MSPLDGRLRHTRQRLAVLQDTGGITNHKNVGMAWHRQVALHLDTSTTVHLGPKPFASRRGLHPGQPEGVIRLNVLIPHLHPMLVQFLDMDTLDDLHA